MTAPHPASRLLPVLLAALLAVLLPTVHAASPARAEESPAPAGTATQAPNPTPSTSPAPANPDAAAPAAPTRTYSLGERTLRKGVRGADVVALQKLLRVKRTGVFDTATKKKVKKVQRLAGLKANGVVKKKTLKAIKRWSRGELSTSRSLPRAGSPAASKRYAAAYIRAKYGWGSGQMSCLSALWTRESGWRYWVSNPNGIYRGIPQTSSRVWGPLGYTTAQYMRSPEIQIKVGTHYIKKRYGTPCNAWSFWRARHWY